LSETQELYHPIKKQVDSIKIQLFNHIVDPVSYSSFSSQKDPAIVRQYGDRSISKEIDVMLADIRSDYAGDSYLDINITGNSTKAFTFDKHKSKEFHKAVSKKSLGKPIIYTGTIQSLDKPNLTGKFKNSESNRTAVLRIIDSNDFLKIHPYLGEAGEIKFIGSPLIEFGSLEPMSGDIWFLCLYSEYIDYMKS
jgi:hypothetical protein